MRLTSILAAAALLATPAAAVAQAHGGARLAAGHAGAGAAASAHSVTLAHLGPGRIEPGHVGFRGLRRHPGFRDRFDRRTAFVGLYPFWGWDCADGCDLSDDDPPGPTPANYAEPPVAPPGYALTAWSPPRADANECSDWVWNARLRHSVCKRPYSG